MARESQKTRRTGFLFHGQGLGAPRGCQLLGVALLVLWASGCEGEGRDRQIGLSDPDEPTNGSKPDGTPNGGGNNATGGTVDGGQATGSRDTGAVGGQDATNGGGGGGGGAFADAGAGGGGTSSGVGGPCLVDQECADGLGQCIPEESPNGPTGFAGGYCIIAGCSAQSPCPSGAECYIIDDQMNTACLDSCAGASECRPGYDCVAEGACIPSDGGGGGGGGGSSPVGGACTSASDCSGAQPTCVPEQTANGPTGFSGGYCTTFGCDAQTPCPSGSECFVVNSNNETACLASCSGSTGCRSGYACQDPGACLPACDATSCASGTVCGPQGTCVEEACTTGSCPQGLMCDGLSGRCVVDVGQPPPLPIPQCPSIPTWQCSGTETYCGELIPFMPEQGDGYWNYPINGESPADQYRSYSRRDVQLLVKHAAASVACLAQNWSVGNGGPVGLGDMSEANGAIPGTSIGQPGHPAGTHQWGRDMDIGYFQINTPDNTLRPVCTHMQSGQDMYHCLGDPGSLDVWRTALFIAKLHASSQLRVIGVDGRVGPLVQSAITQLCAAGWVNTSACQSPALAFETTDEGRGWYLFHHHHLHISLADTNGNGHIPGVAFSGPEACMVPDCRSIGLRRLSTLIGLGARTISLR